MRRSFALLKVLLCVGLSCMSLLLAVGYAAISGTMVITGTAKYEPGVIYITEVIEGSEKFPKFGYLTLLGNHTFTSKNETYTVKVKVKNNSGIDQYFSEVLIPEGSPNYSVSKVVTSAGVTARGTPLLNGATETYTITYKSGDNSVVLKDAQSQLSFTPDFDSLTGIVASGIAERFLQILNKDIPYITVDEEDMTADAFLTELKDNMNDANSGSYISNVSGAEPRDKVLVDAAFGDYTNIELEGADYPVKGLIKEQNVTGDSTAEMVLYVSADPLSKGGGMFSMNRVPVYAIVFELQNGGWVQNKPMLAGTAPVTNYNGSFGTNNTGSFSTDYWESTEYKVSTWYGGSTAADISEAYEQAPNLN